MREKGIGVQTSPQKISDKNKVGEFIRTLFESQWNMKGLITNSLCFQQKQHDPLGK
jgi:hypothetical protein